MLRVWRLFPPRKSRGALSRTRTRAPASLARRAAHKPALPPPTTATSNSRGFWFSLPVAAATAAVAGATAAAHTHAAGHPAARRSTGRSPSGASERGRGGIVHRASGRGTARARAVVIARIVVAAAVIKVVVVVAYCQRAEIGPPERAVAVSGTGKVGEHSVVWIEGPASGARQQTRRPSLTRGGDVGG